MGRNEPPIWGGINHRFDGDGAELTADLMAIGRNKPPIWRRLGGINRRLYGDRAENNRLSAVGRNFPLLFLAVTSVKFPEITHPNNFLNKNFILGFSLDKWSPQCFDLMLDVSFIFDVF